MANVIYGSEIAKQVKEDLRLRIMKLKMSKNDSLSLLSFW